MLDKYIIKFFAWYSSILVRFYYLFIALPLLLTGILSFGFIWSQELLITDQAYLFTPTHSKSYTERRRIEELWPLKNDRFIPGRNYEFFFMILFVYSREKDEKGDRKNLLDSQYLDAIKELDRFLTHNITIQNVTHQKISYQDLCLGWEECYSISNQKNSPILNLLRRRKWYAKQNVKITYPRTNTDGNPLFMGYQLGGVDTDDEGVIQKVRSIRLTYFLQSDTKELTDLSLKWGIKALNYFQAHYSNNDSLNSTKLLQGSGVHERSFDFGIHENLNAVRPVFIYLFAVLALFAVTCSIKLRFERGKGLFGCTGIDLLRSKPLLAMGGLAAPAMGCVSGMGLVFLCGMNSGEISLCSPILIVAIGIDDMFILLTAWHRTSLQSSLPERMKSALSEAAVTVTITSATDALSFAVGCLTYIPAVEFFCRDAALSVIFTYIYVITFFAGLLVVAGIVEEQQHNAFVPCLKLSIPKVEMHAENNNSTIKSGKDLPTGGELTKRGQPSAVDKSLQINGQVEPMKPKENRTFFRNYYGVFLLSRPVKIFVSVLFLLYLGVAIYFCTKLRLGSEAGDLISPDDPIQDFMRVERRYFSNGIQADVVVAKCPDLAVQKNRDQMLRIAEAFEASEYISEGGENGTQFWLRAYLNYLKRSGSYEADGVKQWDQGAYWFTQKAHSFRRVWSQDVVFQNVSGRHRITSFRFRISIGEYNVKGLQSRAVQDFRSIAERFAEFDVFTYGLYWFNGDSLQILLPNTLQNTGIALLCMIIVSITLIPNIFAVVWTALALISIDIGVVGFMTLWGVKLEPISMISVIMSIGFSVDFTAHITYGYVSSQETSPRLKTLHALERIGWPIFQGSVSTILGVSVLFIARPDLYTAVTFFKTVFLVIALGLLHAIVFLPVALSSTMTALTELSESLKFRIKNFKFRSKNNKPVHT